VITRDDIATLQVLAQPRTASARMRRRMTIGAAGAIGTLLLLLIAFAELRDTVTDPSNYGQREPVGGFAPIVAQPENRVGTAVAVVLLTLPLITLIMQALHVGQLAQDRNRSALSLAGATPQELRRASCWETATAFACGAVLSGPAYVTSWVLLGVLPAPGSRLIPGVDWRLAVSWLGVVAALSGAGAVVGVIEHRNRPADALGTVRPPAPSAHLILGIIAGCGALYLPRRIDELETLMGDYLPFVLVVEIVLLVTAIAALVTWCTSRVRPSKYRADQAVEMLAAAQRRGYPGGAGWVGAVLFVCGLAFFCEVTFLWSVMFDSDTLAGDVMFYAGPTFVAMGAGGGATVVAIAALAIRTADHLMTTRRAVAATAALGVEPKRLLAVQRRVLASTAVPATLAGYLTPTLAIVILGPTPTLVAALLIAPILPLGIGRACRLVAALLAPRITASSSVEHLRTP
jgi:hypothetical protein